MLGRLRAKARLGCFRRHDVLDAADDVPGAPAGVFTPGGYGAACAALVAAAGDQYAGLGAEFARVLRE